MSWQIHRLQSRLGCVSVGGQPLLLKELEQELEFRHREAMAGGERSAVARVINEGNPQAQSWVGTRRVRWRNLRSALSST